MLEYKVLQRRRGLACGYLRRAFNWYAVNGGDDDFVSPIVPGMARTKPRERARDRILSDDDQPDRTTINRLWDVLDEPELKRAMGQQNMKKPPAR